MFQRTPNNQGFVVAMTSYSTRFLVFESNRQCMLGIDSHRFCSMFLQGFPISRGQAFAGTLLGQRTSRYQRPSQFNDSPGLLLCG